MKNIKFLFPLLFFGALAFMFSSCNVQESVDSNGPTPQLANSGNAIYCRDCPNGCILGFAFTTANIDGNHPQGGYQISVLEGDCSCGGQSGNYHVITSGTITSQIGQVGGPASGSLPDPLFHAWHLFSFHCGGVGGVIGNVTVGQSWSNFVHQFDNNYTGPLNPGIIEWPEAWDVEVNLLSPGGDVQINLPGVEQSQALDQINLYQNSSEDAIASINATGANDYSLDLSELPAGNYSVELQFSAGFSLHTPLYRYIAGE